MVVYDLRCASDHVFEAWFADSDTFALLAEAGDLECPLCGDREVGRIPVAPNVSTPRESAAPQNRERTARAMKALTNARQVIEQNCEHVGDRFAAEARKIHYGEVDRRNIYGKATLEEAETLREEGVEFGEIPFPIRQRDA